MRWDDKKIEILRNEWGKGKTDSPIAEMIGGVSRNAVIGKAHRLNLSIKIKPRNNSHNFSKTETSFNKKIIGNAEKSPAGLEVMLCGGVQSTG